MLLLPLQGACTPFRYVLCSPKSDGPRPVRASKQTMKGRASVLRPFRHTSTELHAIEAQFAGKLWAFAPVENGAHWALGVVVANEATVNLVDPDLCSADLYDELQEYADRLNRSRGLTNRQTLLIARGEGLSDERVRDWREHTDEFVKAARSGPVS